MIIAPFANAGGYTVFDNTILDHVMKLCAPNTWKVVCAVLRHTVGWQKKQDMIAYSQLQKITGIASRSTLTSAIADAISQGYVVRAPKRNSFVYALNRNYTIDIPDDPSGQTSILPNKQPATEGKKYDERLKHPAIVAYRSECRLTVPYVLRSDIINAVGSSADDIKRWRSIIHEWVGLGYNKQNIVGMLDAYRKGHIARQGYVKQKQQPKKIQYRSLTEERLRNGG